ncbi:hypothetical protein SEMRO_617_G176080.1 [Seminavis robusta]|uniref:Uncharacterized protein n=1 Tax=Seminavis robusta TaxID=568900 RepID=A0A9N8E3J3_9STRA|nr:hypothetical protein SEMRO_617_G176080.1 [Seminavis robusta]|eukprot:Sro617_g176080.1 n/a (135) ;mRNA; f:17904-18308
MYRHEQTYKNELDAWKLYHKTEAQILQQILDAFNDTYTKALKDRMWGYGNTSPFDIITHLVTKYGKITETDLLANRELLTQPWTPPTDIEELFDNIDTCIAFSVEGGDVISDRNDVSAGIATLQATGLFIHPIR